MHWLNEVGRLGTVCKSELELEMALEPHFNILIERAKSNVIHCAWDTCPTCAVRNRLQRLNSIQTTLGFSVFHRFQLNPKCAQTDPIKNALSSDVDLAACPAFALCAIVRTAIGTSAFEIELRTKLGFGATNSDRDAQLGRS